MFKNKIKSARLFVCDTHLNNKLVQMPAVSNLKIYTPFFLSPFESTLKNEVYQMKSHDFWWFLSHIYQFVRSSAPKLTLELFSSRSVVVVDVVVVVFCLNFVVLSLSRTVSMRHCFRCLSARQCDMQFRISFVCMYVCV